MLKLLVFLFLLVVFWPLALLAVVLVPVAWTVFAVLKLVFGLVGTAVEIVVGVVFVVLAVIAALFVIPIVMML